MTLPANVRLNVKVSFPTAVNGLSFISVTKKNGLWYIAPDYTLLAAVPVGYDPNAWFVPLENLSTKVFGVLNVSALIAAATSMKLAPVLVNVTPYAVQPGDRYLRINVAAPTTLNLTAASARLGLPLTVKDISGNASNNNITLHRAGADTIDGAAADLVMNGDRQAVTITPNAVDNTANGWDRLG